MQPGQEISQFRGAALDSSSVGSQAGRARPQRRCADVVAHNLARWTARIGLGEPVVTTKTPRRRFFSLAGRLTPLGSPPHFASSPALALGSPVQWRPGTIASPSISGRTAATSPLDPPSGQLNVHANSRQPSP